MSNARSKPAATSATASRGTGGNEPDADATAAPARATGAAGGAKSAAATAVAAALKWSARDRLAVRVGPALLLLAAFVVLLLGLAYGGGAKPLQLADPGPIVMYGVPVARLAFNLTASVTIGALVFALTIVSRDGPEFERAMQIASSGATAWVVATLASAFFTFMQIANVPLSASDQFGEQLWFFFTGIEVGRLWVLALVMVAVLSTLAFAVRSAWGVAFATALALLSLWPVGSQGHAAGAANHELAVGGITLHITGAAVWLGGLVLLCLLLPKASPSSRLVVLERYSTLALMAFVAVAGSGVVVSVLNLGDWAALATPYGGLVIAKTVVLVALGVFGVMQRTLLIGRMRAATDAGRPARRPLVMLLGLEAAVMGVVAGLAAALGRTKSPVPQLTADQLSSPSPAQILTGQPLPPEFEPFRLLTEWTLDPMWTTIVGFAVFFYVAGVVRLRRRGDSWPVRRTISFLLGMAVLLYLVNGPLIVYGKVLFSAHMTQHMVLTMIVPIFIVVGAPVTLLLRAVHARTDGSMGAREWVLKIVQSKWARFISHPIVCAIMFAGSLLVFYYTPLFRWAVTDHVGHMWMVADFLIVGYLFVQSLIGTDPGYRAPFPMRFISLVLVMTFHAFFGLAVMSGTGLLLADWYGAMGRPWGLSAIGDQQLGGSISWGLGEFPTVFLAVLVALEWSRSDAREAKRLDRKAARDGDADLEAYNARLRALANADARRRETAGGVAARAEAIAEMAGDGAAEAGSATPGPASADAVAARDSSRGPRA